MYNVHCWKLRFFYSRNIKYTFAISLHLVFRNSFHWIMWNWKKVITCCHVKHLYKQFVKNMLIDGNLEKQILYSINFLFIWNKKRVSILHWIDHKIITYVEYLLRLSTCYAQKKCVCHTLYDMHENNNGIHRPSGTFLHEEIASIQWLN